MFFRCLFVLIGLLVITVKSDLPVHCLVQNIIGKDWMLEFKDSLTQIRHGDVEKVCKDGMEMDVKKVVELSLPNIVKSKNGKVIGTWTVVADQGFEIRIGKMTFFAFFKYDTPSEHEVISYCDRTLIGTVTLGKRWGCFRAHRENPQKGIHHKPVSELINEENNLSQTKTDDDVAFQNNHQVIDHVNKVQSYWKASAYPHLEKMTIGELKRRSGNPLRSHSIKELKETLQKKTIEEDDDTFLFFGGARVKKNSRRIPNNLPKSWDWRNATLDGKTYENFVSPVRDQLSCGSCYVLAFVDALEARVRVLTKNRLKLDLSSQYAVSCNPYAQKCRGGYPYGVAKFVHDFDMVTDECFPYEANNSTCSKRCKNPSVVIGVKDYGYIGGYYGNANEVKMMEEIHKNGPISTSIFVYDDFKYYKSGVYHHVEGLGGPNGLQGKWELTSHSVCIVGWGEETINNQVVPYWIVKNSWSSNWGDKGFIKIRRGIDESASESQPVYFNPIIKKAL